MGFKALIDGMSQAVWLPIYASNHFKDCNNAVVGVLLKEHTIGTFSRIGIMCLSTIDTGPSMADILASLEKRESSLI